MFDRVFGFREEKTTITCISIEMMGIIEDASSSNNRCMDIFKEIDIIKDTCTVLL